MKKLRILIALHLNRLYHGLIIKKVEFWTIKDLGKGLYSPNLKDVGVLERVQLRFQFFIHLFPKVFRELSTVNLRKKIILR